MGFIFVVVLAFISVAAHADPPQQWVADPPNGTTYLERSLCPGACVPLVQDGVIMSLEENSIQTVQEPDGSTVKFSRRDCADESQCQQEISVMSCPTAAPIYRAQDSGGWEAYCPEPGLRSVRKLMPDPAKAAAKRARVQAETDLENQVLNSRSQLKAAVQNWDSLTAAQQKAVLRHLVRLILRE